MERVKNYLATGVVMVKTFYLHIIAFALVLTSVFVIYGNDFVILANEALQNESSSHILLLPVFVGFLFYLKKDAVKAALTLEKHHMRKNTKYLNEISGLVLCIVAVLVYWYGSQTFYPLEYHIISLPIFLSGVTLILLNPRALMVLIFPILFPLFLIPIPSTALYTVGGGLANFNTQVAYSILTIVGVPLTLSSSYGAPTILLTNASGQAVTFSVDLACSGIYSLVAFTMFATFLALLAKTSLFKKLLLFILGFSVFVFLNIIRITAIVGVGYVFGEEAALLLHSFAGIVLIFSGMLFLFAFSDKFLKIRMVTKPQEQPPCTKCKRKKPVLANFCENCGRFINGPLRPVSKRSFILLVLLLLGSVVAVMSISAPTFVTAQDSIELSSIGNLQNATNVFPELPNYTLTFFYRDTEYERISEQDSSLVYTYLPSNLSEPVVYAVVGVSSSMWNLHNWEVCLITFQTAQGQYPLVDVHDSREIQLLDDSQLIAKFLVFDSPDNYTQVTLYWYEKATFNTGLTVESKYVRISLIILTENATGYPQLEEKLLEIGQLIATTWKPLETQSLISLGIPAQQVLLVVLIAFLVVTLTTQYLNERRKASNNLKLFQSFATPKEKVVFQTMFDLAKEKKNITTSDVLEKLRKKTGFRSMSYKKLLGILNVLDEYGLIRRTVVSVDHTPLFVWRV